MKYTKLLLIFYMIFTSSKCLAQSEGKSSCTEKMLSVYTEYSELMKNLDKKGNHYEVAKLRDIKHAWDRAENSKFYSKDVESVFARVSESIYGWRSFINSMSHPISYGGTCGKENDLFLEVENNTYPERRFLRVTFSNNFKIRQLYNTEENISKKYSVKLIKSVRRSEKGIGDS